jgi:hypothetical protein
MDSFMRQWEVTMDFIWLLVLALGGALLTFSLLALVVLLILGAFTFEPLEPKGNIERKKTEDKN